MLRATDMGSKNPYPHTVFRFPFRKPGHSSQISEKVYDSEVMLQLLESTKQEGQLYNLFLKSIESIQVLLAEKKLPVDSPYRAS